MTTEPKRRKWRWLALGAVVAVIIWASGITSWPDEIKGLRPATEQDELIRYFAQQLAEPSLCEQIPWRAALPGGFFIASSYERSECYAFIAGRTRKPWPCLKVRRLGAFALLSSQTSKWSCLRDAWKGRNVGIAVSSESLVTFLTKLGYSPETIDQEGITPPIVNLREVYDELSLRPDVVSRIRAAIGESTASPGFAGIDERSGSYLADLAAIVTKDDKWCTRIPGNVDLTNEKRRFRDWCFFTLASNTKKSALCQRIPIPENGTDRRLSLEANCERQADSSQPRGPYSPEVPTDDERIRALMVLLNYPIPEAKDLPVETVYAAYGRFLDELNRQNDARHVAARQRFLKAVMNGEVKGS